MMEIPSGLNFHNFYRDCQPETYFKRKKSETIIQWLGRVSYQPGESMLLFTINNKYWLDVSYDISLSISSFLRENNMNRETLEELIGFELDLHGKYEFTIKELKKLELYTNIKFLC